MSEIWVVEMYAGFGVWRGVKVCANEEEAELSAGWLWEGTSHKHRVAKYVRVEPEE